MPPKVCGCILEHFTNCVHLHSLLINSSAYCLFHLAIELQRLFLPPVEFCIIVSSFKFVAMEIKLAILLFLVFIIYSKKSFYFSRFQNISSLNYTLQTSLDALEISRQTLLERLVEIDQTMCMPKEEDIERVRACPICQSGDGPLCVHCELDELFQV